MDILDGLKVVDCTQILAGPFCTMMLGDMGADIIKVEKPNGGDDIRRFGPPFIEGESAAFLMINRNGGQNRISHEISFKMVRKCLKLEPSDLFSCPNSDFS